MTKAIVGKKRVTISLDHCNSKIIKYFFSVFFHSTGGTLCLMSYLYQPARREMQTWKPLLVSFVACVIIHVNSSTLVNIYLHLGFSISPNHQCSGIPVQKLSMLGKFVNFSLSATVCTHFLHIRVSNKFPCCDIHDKYTLFKSDTINKCVMKL